MQRLNDVCYLDLDSNPNLASPTHSDVHSCGLFTVAKRLPNMAKVINFRKCRRKPRLGISWLSFHSSMDEPMLKRIKKPASKLNIENTSVDHPNTAEVDYRLKFYALFDTVMSCIMDRFFARCL